MSLMSDETNVSDSRAAQRYVLTAPIEGGFGAFGIQIIDFSETGLQARHDEPIKPGAGGRLSFSIPGASERVSLRGRVVWSHLAKKPDERGKHPYLSGIRIEESVPDVASVIQRLVAAEMAKPDEESIEKKRKALREKQKERAQRLSMKTMTVRAEDVTSDQLLMIQAARERLQTHPDEAKKWYARAKFVLQEDPTKVPMHYREDVLAVWEYLERTIPLEKILKVFEEHRR